MGLTQSNHSNVASNTQKIQILMLVSFLSQSLKFLSFLYFSMAMSAAKSDDEPTSSGDLFESIDKL